MPGFFSILPQAALLAWHLKPPWQFLMNLNRSHQNRGIQATGAKGLVLPQNG